MHVIFLVLFSHTRETNSFFLFQSNPYYLNNNTKTCEKHKSKDEIMLVSRFSSQISKYPHGITSMLTSVLYTLILQCIMIEMLIWLGMLLLQTTANSQWIKYTGWLLLSISSTTHSYKVTHIYIYIYM